MTNAFALIPARGGSKGIPRKNVRLIAGKPLIAWTIEAAKASGVFERVVVSSDDDEILAVAAEYGAETLKRPAELASDTAGAKSVLSHALEAYRDTHGALPHFVAYLQPTSPLRTAQHLRDAFNLLEGDTSADAVISVSEIDNAYLKASITNPEGYMEYAVGREFANMNRQMLPKLYMPNGAIYIMETEKCLAEPRFDGDKTLPYVMLPEESIDLDTPEDIPPVEAVLVRRA
ncbi:MAG: acylneuraminate cytidylyltransferase family protein [Patescibacteria group bacterium]